jgi:uncharacterized protein (TIGR03032 family)
MTSADSGPPPDVDATITQSPSPADAFRYVHSAGFPELLASRGVSLLVSTYQAGKLLVFRAVPGRLSLLVRTFDQAMGLAVDRSRLAIGTRYQIWTLRNAPDIAPQIEPRGQHDACYMPRASHVTGDIRVHELAWAGDELWIVNTRFSCLCTLDPNYSFVPRWRPPFISDLAAEDRCHLNGLAVEGGAVRYVTAHGITDAPEGWRAAKATGGAVIAVPHGDVVATGLAMPHSPRIAHGRLYVLDSGRGRLVTIDPATGQCTTVAQLPGYCRGLAICGPYAFVGLSKVRETATFGDVPICEQFAHRRSGVWVIDLTTGQTTATLEFQGEVAEIFDIQILSGIRFPAVLGLQKEAVGATFVVPSATV